MLACQGTKKEGPRSVMALHVRAKAASLSLNVCANLDCEQP